MLELYLNNEVHQRKLVFTINNITNEIININIKFVSYIYETLYK